jgi:hypothetical protein
MREEAAAAGGQVPLKSSTLTLPLLAGLLSVALLGATTAFVRLWRSRED